MTVVPGVAPARVGVVGPLADLAEGLRIGDHEEDGIGLLGRLRRRGDCGERRGLLRAPVPDD